MPCPVRPASLTVELGSVMLVGMGPTPVRQSREGRRRDRSADSGPPRRRRPAARTEPSPAHHRGGRGGGLAAGVFGLLHSPVFSARHVTVKVPRPSPLRGPLRGRARELATLIDLDAAVIAARVERLPWVAKAAVKISWPSSVSIRLTERTPVADVKDAGRYAVCDRRPGDRAPRVADALPPVVKISGRPGPAGSLLAVQDRPLAAVAAAMPESLVRRTVEIALSPTAGIVVVLREGITAELGGAGSLAQKFVSLATCSPGFLQRPARDRPAGGRLTLLIRNPAGPIVPGNTSG